MGIFDWLVGSSAWHRKSTALKEVEHLFSAEELERIKAQFQRHGCSDYTSTLDHATFMQQICALPYLHQQLAADLVAAIKRCSPSTVDELTPDAVIIAKAKLEKCGDDSSQTFCFSILDPAAAGAVARNRLHALVNACLQLIFYQSKISGIPNDDSVSALVSGALQAATPNSITSGSCTPAAESLTLDGYKRWCKSNPAFHNLLSSLLHHIGEPAPAIPATSPLVPSPTSPLHRPLPPAAVPTFIVNNAIASSLTGCLLDPASAWCLSHCLPLDQQQEWRLLFNSSRHGMSFNTLVAKLAEAAPTMLLIRDKAGHLFGGVASQPWQKKGTFYGDFASFIFSLQPCASVHHASGINQNFQWCGIGFSQLPNGLGFGGQVGHFALYVDSTLEAGISRPSATYASPCLASQQTFEVAEVECWLLKPPEDDPLLASGSKGSGKQQGSVLDKHKEDQQLLQLAGVGSSYSQGLRKPDEPIE